MKEAETGYDSPSYIFINRGALLSYFSIRTLKHTSSRALKIKALKPFKSLQVCIQRESSSDQSSEKALQKSSSLHPARKFFRSIQREGSSDQSFKAPKNIQVKSTSNKTFFDLVGYVFCCWVLLGYVAIGSRKSRRISCRKERERDFVRERGFGKCCLVDCRRLRPRFQQLLLLCFILFASRICAVCFALFSYLGVVVPVGRRYLLCTVGSVYIKSKEAPAKDVLKDLVQMCRGIQHSISGLFLRSYLSQVNRDNLLDIGSEYEGDADTVMDTVEFILQNFTEMNKLWVQMHHQGPAREKERREKERSELCDLVGKNLHVFSQIEGVDLDMYRETVLPRVL
ncbi:uncharacterized protein LOC131327725 [Rhododendron vialii]|uniref:uncharacterized protein LOC131327725 n=1 Tax=Rhododendron vialii TaxID=182163 RepID=UPI00265F0D95|nr:uncharacterized protein LOC131327725 [Rhododendron vialii]